MSRRERGKMLLDGGIVGERGKMLLDDVIVGAWEDVSKRWREN